MAFGDSPFDDLKVPLRWTITAATLLAVLIAVGLLVGDRRSPAPGEGGDPVYRYGAVRGGFDTAAAPVAGALAAPVRWSGSALDYVRGYFGAVDENRRLRIEAAEGRRWRDAALALREQNARLAALLRLRIEPPAPSVAARAVLDARGPFSQARLINAGRDAGVLVGHPVLSEYGLVGRVVGVARGVSRVLMLTDAASRVPVMVERTDARAILAGDAAEAPRLDYLRGESPIRPGDRVLTSGDGGVFPRGLPVGVAVRDRQGWRVRLYADRAPISYVRVLLFDDFSRLDGQPELNTVEPPSGPPLAPTEPAGATATPPAAASGTPAGPAAAAAPTAPPR